MMMNVAHDQNFIKTAETYVTGTTHSHIKSLPPSLMRLVTYAREAPCLRRPGVAADAGRAPRGQESRLVSVGEARVNFIFHILSLEGDAWR